MTMWKQRLVVGLLAVGAAMGCGNPIVSLAYLFNNGDPKTPPEYPLTPQPQRKHEEVRVVVVTSAKPGLFDFTGVDQVLAAEFTKVLEAMAKENKEKIVVLKSQPVSRYRQDHPEWKSHHPVDIGKHFGADYVIDMEVLSMSIFEQGTNRQLMRGRASIALSAYDLSKPDKVAALEQEYTPVFPVSHEVSIDDEPISKFRQRFIQRIATELAIKFSPHTSSESVPVD